PVLLTFAPFPTALPIPKQVYRISLRSLLSVIAWMLPMTRMLASGTILCHQAMPKVYTWPNDPEVFGGDAPLYRVVFSPGNTLLPITESTAEFPLCSSLP